MLHLGISISDHGGELEASARASQPGGAKDSNGSFVEGLGRSDWLTVGEGGRDHT